jgi:hypothetical protein
MSPDNRQHRGAHPCDRELFDNSNLSSLREATGELSWLLSRRYALKSALKLVGDRHNLAARQRLAISRAACSDEQREHRKTTRLDLEAISGERLIVDGFNLIITVEAALGGGVLIICRDGTLRDLSGVHGSYRDVSETGAAIGLIGEMLDTANPASAKWLLDRPISNSGRLGQMIVEMATERRWPWTVGLVTNPDSIILSSGEIAVTSDSIVLDGATRWVNLALRLVRERVAQAWIVDLSF